MELACFGYSDDEPVLKDAVSQSMVLAVDSVV